MKKIYFFLLLFLLSVPVFAEEYEVNSYIPVEQSATVHTEKFDYNDFIFSSKADEKGNGKLVFSSIKNNTMSKTAISINVLLFDEDKKNVGYLTYCSDRDYANDSNRGFKLNGGETQPFTIDVTSRFFAEGKELKDVFYIVVADENKYCQIGGYDQYAGLTLEEIQGNALPDDGKPVFNFVESILKNTALVLLIASIVGILIVYIVIGSVLNNLNYKMHGKRTILCFLPITNLFIGVKLAFGKIIAIIYIIFFFISCGLVYFGINYISLIFSGIWIVAFLIDIIKILTRKYELFYFDPSVKESIYENALDDKPTNTVDLSYSNKTLTEDDILGNNISSESNESSIEEDDTDLTKLFR